MVTVRHLLKDKGQQTYSVSPKASVLDALRLMYEKEIGAVLVTEENRVVGIFSERDYARQVAQTERANLDTAVEVFMTQVVYGVKLDQTIDECMGLMTQRHIRHLPVLDDDQLVGVISIGDVVKEVISDREATIQGLENYIVGHEYIH
jgi:CBS domain-containing protein